jgi:restriction system protein
VKLGVGGKYVENARKGNYVAIGWHDLGALHWLADAKSDDEALNRLSELYHKTYPQQSKVQVSIDVGQVFNFVRKVSVGDIVFVPDPPRRMMLACKVEGGYDYREDWKDGCVYLHRKKVTWLLETSRDELPQKLKNSLGAQLTVFSVDRHAETIQELLTGTHKVRTEREVTGEHLAKAVVDKLMELDPKKFQEFISHLLNILGFEAASTEYVGDKGIDVMGKLNAEGLTTIPLHVQVKRITGSIGIEEVQRIRGTLGADDHGAIVTTSHFTKQAQEEALAENRKQIELVDGEALVELILRHYDELDEEYRILLPLKPRELPVTERFTMSTPS